ncbi:hypothetical protein BV20DRAFT_1050801 [Pilatotrama ljubarskyi]|nr:hypothetical protein BV20DRAFT_1050801 [Pilatotrama ljubarskyi]
MFHILELAIVSARVFCETFSDCPEDVKYTRVEKDLTRALETALSSLRAAEIGPIASTPAPTDTGNLHLHQLVPALVPILRQPLLNDLRGALEVDLRVPLHDELSVDIRHAARDGINDLVEEVIPRLRQLLLAELSTSLIAPLSASLVAPLSDALLAPLSQAVLSQLRAPILQQVRDYVGENLQATSTPPPNISSGSAVPASTVGHSNSPKPRAIVLPPFFSDEMLRDPLMVPSGFRLQKRSRSGYSRSGSHSEREGESKKTL